jgi:hypothetical protein
MNPFLESVQQKLTRSIEQIVYSKLLECGLTPDRIAFANNPAGYAAKQSEIKARKGFCVEVFGHGAPSDRDNKYIPRIVITGLGFFGGSLGNDGQVYYEKNKAGKFDAKQAPLKSSNYRFDLELTSNKASQDNVLEAIRAEALPQLSYVPVYDTAGDEFLLQYGGIRNIPDFSHGLIKKIYTYEILDVFERMTRTISEIVPIKEITVSDTNGDELKVPNT